MSRPVALVTGASSGIGHALALVYARRGHDVVALARRRDRLEELGAAVSREGATALAVSCDVTADGQLDAAVAQALDRFGRIDVAVANAGTSISGALAELTLADYRRVFETNVFGVLRTAYAVRAPLAASRGAFGVVGSVTGYLTLPGFSAYAASKHAVRSLAEALRHEWRADGISVTHIAPGFVASEIRKLDASGRVADRPDPIPAWLVMPAEEAARQIADAMAEHRAEVVLTNHGKAATLVARHAPWILTLGLRLAGSRVGDGFR